MLIVPNIHFLHCHSHLMGGLSASYFSYICVVNGKQITPKVFYRALPKRNHEMFDCQ